MYWLVIALSYVLGAEVALFFACKKVSIDSLPDSRDDEESENVVEKVAEVNNFTEDTIDLNTNSNVSPENGAVEENTPKIKFDL